MKVWDKKGILSGHPLPQRSAKAAFTLIEIMLAMALSALLLALLYSTYFAINRSIDAATENQEALEIGRILSEMITKDIRGISMNGYSLVGKNEGPEDEPFGRVEFVTTSKMSSEQMGLRRIGYELRAGEGNERILVKMESQDLNDPLGSTARVFELSRLIKGFCFEFYNGTDWVNEWNSSSSGALPKQIKVVIDVLDTKGNVRQFIANESIQSAF
jgi:type II secretion system protein J